MYWSIMVLGEFLVFMSVMMSFLPHTRTRASSLTSGFSSFSESSDPATCVRDIKTCTARNGAWKKLLLVGQGSANWSIFQGLFPAVLMLRLLRENPCDELAVCAGRLQSCCSRFCKSHLLVSLGAAPCALSLGGATGRAPSESPGHTNQEVLAWLWQRSVGCLSTVVVSKQLLPSHNLKDFHNVIEM